MTWGGHPGLFAVRAPDDAFKVAGCALPFSDLDYCPDQVPDHMSQEAVRFERELETVRFRPLQNGPQHVAFGRAYF